MSKFLPQKRRLLEEVFKKASDNTTERSFSGILKSLERDLLDDFRISLSYRTFETYYKAIVDNDGDYNIKPAILDDLSKYLEYDDFRSFCLDWKTIEYTVSQTLSKIVINITNKPIFNLPDVFKKNGLGIMEMVFVLLLVTGGVVFSNNKTSKSLGFMSGWGSPATDKPYMYWDKDRYMATDSSSLHSRVEVVPMRDFAFINMKKIMRPDTLTVDNAMGKVWYDKSNNHVEFFTGLGKHPENGKALKDVTEYILETYAGENAVLEEE
ncbi:hypothetical protein [uncultured Chryseobacterium sp.]|uniref:hypothetical protein n=1 Tax=uncultured Chryseobacterium sp. TaxID=259322 RepID=UPI0037499B5B